MVVPGPSRLARAHLGALAAAVTVLALTPSPVGDLDIFWHLRLGDAVLDGVPVGRAADGWTFTAHGGWTTTQWLAEVALAAVARVGGLHGLVVLRTVLAALTLGVLAAVTLRGTGSARGRAAVLSLAAVAVLPVLVDRPQTFSVVALPWLGLLLRDGLRGRPAPTLLLLLPVTVLWTNVHGYWVLLPAVLVLAAAGRALDLGPRSAVAGPGVARPPRRRRAGAGRGVRQPGRRSLP